MSKKPRYIDDVLRDNSHKDQDSPPTKTLRSCSAPVARPTAVELDLARRLASSSKSVRQEALTAVQRVLCAAETPLRWPEMRRLWRALFYTLWFADRPVAIEAVIRRLVRLLEVSADPYLYFRGMLECLVREWPSIDHHRLDKYYALLTDGVAAAAAWGVSHGSADDWQACRCIARIVEEEVFQPLYVDKVHFADDVAAEAREPPRRGSVGVALHLCDVWVARILESVPPDERQHLSFAVDSRCPADMYMEPIVRLFVVETNRAAEARLPTRKRLMARAAQRVWKVLEARWLTRPPEPVEEASWRTHAQEIAQGLFQRASGTGVPDYGRRLLYETVRHLRAAVELPSEVSAVPLKRKRKA
ncbi:hypothetical protein CDCA_CDCA04G1265 [Cyanidium caldarium]|uniref:Uncharacterized protein n=1 Tax=Cyanidium caldarium TaxID=2771 RepID=A0AAV9IT17_CYACA|nr:hypothetical protein CDCA_CDCA04G1265 [Cyanidium caldarium]